MSLPEKGKFYRNDLHRLMSQPSSFFTGHTPNWIGDDSERYDSITISVHIKMDGRGLNRKEVAAICKRLEKAGMGRARYRTVSAIC